MHLDKGNKEYSSLKYSIKNINKEIKELESKKKSLTKKQSKFVECEDCGKHFRKNIDYLSTKDEPLDPCDDLNSTYVYFWVCPYCGKKQETHYETTRDKRYWGKFDW